MELTSREPLFPNYTAVAHPSKVTTATDGLARTIYTFPEPDTELCMYYHDNRSAAPAVRFMMGD